MSVNRKLNVCTRQVEGRGKSGAGEPTHPFGEPLDNQSDFQACILNHGHGKLMCSILEIRIVHREDTVAHLQHIALFGRTRRDYVLDEHSGYFAVATDVHLDDRFEKKKKKKWTGDGELIKILLTSKHSCTKGSAG